MTGNSKTCDSRLIGGIGLLAAAMAGLYFISMLVFTKFRLSAPLDDAFIYFQYARKLSMGRFFEYVAGEGYSSGATSFLYAFILAPFAFLLKGSALIPVTYVIGAACLFITGYYIYGTVFKIAQSRVYAIFGALLFMTNG
ncbi:MAG TPA: hypothetical protein P5511_07460, partial [Candidatus Goldiibacteriota bacterium]|nr:hypothetical protein [Candidatus Goldiibacteriota bacterium]